MQEGTSSTQQPAEPNMIYKAARAVWPKASNEKDVHPWARRFITGFGGFITTGIVGDALYRPKLLLAAPEVYQNNALVRALSDFVTDSWIGVPLIAALSATALRRGYIAATEHR